MPYPWPQIIRVKRLDRLDFQLHLAGWHWHHGATGALMAIFPRTRKLGLALMAHDIADFPWLPRKVQ